jgi:hypothetical protein
VRQQLKALLEVAAAQQTESSASHKVRTRLPLGIRTAHKRAGPWRRQSRAVSGLIVTHGTPSRPADGPGASTTIVTTVRATTTTEDVGDATTTTMIMTAAGPQTRGVHEPLARASGMRGSPRVSELCPTYPGTTGTPTPECGSRTTGSRATGGERRTTSSS